MKVRLPELSPIARVRLWFRYQRYAFLLLLAPPLLVASLATVAPWWIITVAALAALAPIRFGVEVWSRWPRKLRATRIAQARIDSGRFTNAHIKNHCGDPCFRLVADEILRRAGTPRVERKLVISRYAEQLRDEGSQFVLIDHVRGTVITVGGESRERQ